MEKVAPAPAAKNVFMAMRAILVLPVVVEPALNPNHPNQRIKTPNAANGRL